MVHLVATLGMNRTSRLPLRVSPHDYWPIGASHNT